MANCYNLLTVNCLRSFLAPCSFALAPLSHEAGWSLFSSVLNNTALYGSTILAVATNNYDADGRVAVVSDWANKAIY